MPNSLHMHIYSNSAAALKNVKGSAMSTFAKFVLLKGSQSLPNYFYQFQP
jgi:hypothetical protein